MVRNYVAGSGDVFRAYNHIDEVFGFAAHLGWCAMA